MKQLAILLVLLVGAFTAAFAQEPAPSPAEEYDRVFARGIDDLGAGRYADGIAAFRRCLELRPENPTCAYNIGCGHALLGERDAAFEWLDRSAEWGFGMAEGNLEHARTDPDLASLRDDPRFAAYLARMTELREAMQAYLREPAVHVPEGVAADEPAGLLVVLHADGGRKEDVVEGPWRRVADRLGLILVAPTGTIPSGVRPEDGVEWFRSADAYRERYWTYEKPVQDAVDGVRKQRSVDRDRVVIAGEGLGGVLAARMAVAGPGLYRGFVTVESWLFEELVADKAANAGKMGLRGRMLMSAEPAFLAGSEVDREQYASYLRARFEAWGLGATVGEPVLIPPARATPRDLAQVPSEEPGTPEEVEAAKRAAAEREEREAAWVAVLVDAVESVLPREAERPAGVPVEAGSKR